MKGSLLTAYLVLGLVIILALLAGLRLQRQQPPANAIIAGLPAMPDLRRWPREMRERVTAASSAAADPGTSTKALSELALLYFSNGYATEAAQTLQVLTRVDPTKGRWPYLLGILKERAGDREGAEAQFASAVRLAPDYAPALIHQANLQGILGRADSARRIFEQCLALAPEDPRVPFGLAKLDYAHGDERAAIERLRSAVRQHPKYQEIHLMLADLLAKAGDAAHAAEQRAFLYGGQSSPPDNDPLLDEAYQYCYDSFRLLSQGESRIVTQDFAGALPYMQRAALLDPQDVEIQEGLARAYIGLHRLEDAQKSLHLALQRTTGANDLLYDRLAEVLSAQSRGNEAIALLLKVQGDRPGSALIENSLGLAYLELGRTAEAIEAFTAAAKLDPIFSDPQFNLARCYLKSENPRLARSWLERALKIRPEALEGLVMLIEATLRMSDIDAAVASAQELYRRGLNVAEYRSIYAATLFRAGNLAAERGEHTKAEQLYRDGLGANDSDGQLHGALGMLCGKLHRYAEARAEFEVFLRLDPRNPLGYVLLGAALNAENKPEEARKTWRTGLSVATERQDRARISQLRQLLGE